MLFPWIFLFKQSLLGTGYFPQKAIILVFSVIISIEYFWDIKFRLYTDFVNHLRMWLIKPNHLQRLLLSNFKFILPCNNDISTICFSEFSYNCIHVYIEHVHMCTYVVYYFTDIQTVTNNSLFNKEMDFILIYFIYKCNIIACLFIIILQSNYKFHMLKLLSYCLFV